MAVRKSVKRRSNWYIYLITFLISAALLGVFVWRIWGMLFPIKDMPVVSSSGVAEYKPDESHNMTVLFMLSEDKGQVPDYFMLINYRPRAEKVVIVPIKKNLSSFVGNTKGTLSELYKEGGASSILFAIKNSLGIDIDHYVKFDKSSFVDFFDFVDTTPMNIPENMNIGDLVLNKGMHYFNGEDLYNYITYDSFLQGEDYTYVLHGSAITNFINSNGRNLSTVHLQNIFNKILNSTDTDLEFTFFTNHQSAFVYSTQNSINIAEYYIPYGDNKDNGTFEISENSIVSIHQRFGTAD